MAKRPALTLDALKAGKPAAPAPVIEAVEPAPVAPAKRGRKPKDDGRLYAMTLRFSPALRKALRAAAEQDTDAGGAVVSVHDVILRAIAKDLRRRNIVVAE